MVVAGELYSLRVGGEQQEVWVHRAEEGRYQVSWPGRRRQKPRSPTR